MKKAMLGHWFLIIFSRVPRRSGESLSTCSVIVQLAAGRRLTSDAQRFTHMTPSPIRHSLLILSGMLLLATTARAAEVLPPKPARHFNDYAGVVTPKTADLVNRGLVGFQNGTTNEVYVVIYPNLLTESPLEDYCYRVTASWRLGHKDLENGIVLFVFVAEHRARIEVRPGLEGALPDATCEDIIADKMAPKFKAGDYDSGIQEGIAAIFQATENEYDAEKIFAAENAKILASWNGWDTFFLIADTLFVFGFCAMGWHKFQHWRHRAAKPATVPVR